MKLSYNRHGINDSETGEQIAVFTESVRNDFKKCDQIVNYLKCSIDIFEVHKELDFILGTALHNGHYDLIAKVKDIVKKAKGLT